MSLANTEEQIEGQTRLDPGNHRDPDLQTGRGTLGGTCTRLLLDNERVQLSRLRDAVDSTCQGRDAAAMRAVDWTSRY